MEIRYTYLDCFLSTGAYQHTYIRFDGLKKLNKLRWYPEQPQRFILTNLSEACEAKRWKHHSPVSVNQMTANPVKPHLALHQSLSEPCWTSPGSAPKLPGTFSRTFSGTLLHQSLPDLLRNPVEPDLALHQHLPDLLRNLLRNPVEPDLALHRSLPDLLRTCWTWPGSAPNPPTPSPELSSEHCWTWLCTKASQNLLQNLLRNPVTPKPPRPSPEPCWTWPGSAPKPPRPSPEPSEPSLEPCWTWLGFAPRRLEPSPEPSLDSCWICPGQSLPDLLRNLLQNPVERDLALHQSLPDLLWNLLRNLRNFLGNLVELDPAPAPVHTGPILGWRPH